MGLDTPEAIPRVGADDRDPHDFFARFLSSTQKGWNTCHSSGRRAISSSSLVPTFCVSSAIAARPGFSGSSIGAEMSALHPLLPSLRTSP